MRPSWDGARPTKATWASLAVLLAAYLVWAGMFISSSSFKAFDGERYYSLFDDAMVSMRYGWNLAHGYGLVWNPGDRVEGYTNLLTTLIMAASTGLFDKSTAVLAMQAFGAATVVGIVLACGWVADELVRHTVPEHRPLARVVGALAGLIYYPLSYWTLMGMETGLVFLLLLLALGCSLTFQRTGSPRLILASGAFAGLAYLARPDSLVPAVAMLVGNQIAIRRGGEDRDRRRRLAVVSIALYLAFPLAQLGFRLLWYGQWVPNTYVLKVEGIPLAARLTNGWDYLLDFLAEAGWVLLAGLLAGVYRPRLPKSVVVTWIVGPLVYLVWVGGDVWEQWRLVCSAVPLAVILIVVSLLEFTHAVDRRKVGRRRTIGSAAMAASGDAGPGLLSIERWIPVGFLAAGILLVAGALLVDPIGVSDPGYGQKQRGMLLVGPLAIAWGLLGRRRALISLCVLLVAGSAGIYVNRGYLDDWMLRRRAMQVQENELNVNTALAIAQVTTEDASVGVFWAGTIPYYTGLWAIDFLGKSDPYIARLPGILESDLTYTPGHNKCDLEYSIVAKQPTYVQGFGWFCPSLGAYRQQHYVDVRVGGMNLSLLRYSEDVDWRMLGRDP
jgi:uncharacterized membrane protein